MKVKKLYYPTDVGYTTQTAKNVISLAQKESGCKIYNAKPNTTIKGGGAILKFIHSSKDYSASNADSVMTYLDYSNLEVLLAEYTD